MTPAMQRATGVHDSILETIVETSREPEPV